MRKAYEKAEGIDVPSSFVTSDQEDDTAPDARHRRRMGDDPVRRPDDLAHDMHVNIVTFQPGRSYQGLAERT